MSRWSDKTEEEKMQFILSQALSYCQYKLLNTPDDLYGIKEYREFLMEVIDYDEDAS
jgi:hypothetical protein